MSARVRSPRPASTASARPPPCVTVMSIILGDTSVKSQYLLLDRLSLVLCTRYLTHLSSRFKLRLNTGSERGSDEAVHRGADLRRRPAHVRDAGCADQVSAGALRQGRAVRSGRQAVPDRDPGQDHRVHPEPDVRAGRGAGLAREVLLPPEP